MRNCERGGWGWFRGWEGGCLKGSKFTSLKEKKGLKFEL